MTEEKQKPIETVPDVKDQLVMTKHTTIINGKTISYTASVGRMILKEEKTTVEGDKKDAYEGDKPRAEIFYVAYTRDDVENAGSRPITFSFNGGPGSASVWVHMGFLGPKKIKLDVDGMPYPGPGEMVDNDCSILDRTDLVFIDPVGTGFSRAIIGDKAKDFWGWQKDIESVGEFIRMYISRNDRWASPKFIAGESYGTTRAVGLADYLSDKHGLYLNGLILISTALDFMTLDFYQGNDLPYALFLPTYAADAWYHKKLAPRFQSMPIDSLLEEVRSFAGGEYLLALFKGSTLTEIEKGKIAKKLAAYTGLRLEYVLQANLRIEIFRFCKELLRDSRQVIGRIDSRYIGYDRDAAGEVPEDDPSSYDIQGVFAAVFNDYVNRELNYKSDISYIISSDLWAHWSYKEYENRFVQLEEMLRKTMIRNKFMKVWVLNGYYDLATPFFASEYVFSHLDLEPAYQKNIAMTYYESGHMIYLHEPSLRKFRKEAESFYAEAPK